MPRRPPVPKACQRCRIKRAKCDGKPQCSRCKAAGEDCIYNNDEKVTKNDLRAEILRLEQLIHDDASNNDSGDYVSDASPSHRPAPQILDRDQVMDLDLSCGLPTPATWSSGAPTSTEVSNTPSAYASYQRPNEPASFNQLLSWRLCRPQFKPDSKRNATAKSKTALYLPPLPSDNVSPSSHLDTWTNTGWTKAYVRHMFDAVATWDYMAFGVMYRDAFLRDYYDNSSRFCSSSLVYSILALANVLMHGDDNGIQVTHSSAIISRAFYQQANAAVLTAKAPNSLPDIQALGIMSLYQLRGGNEQEAEKLARQFHEEVVQFCERQPTLEAMSDEYFGRAKAFTFCGAVSLVRMISMATGQIFNTPVNMLKDGTVALDSMFDHAGTSQGSSHLRSDFITGSEPYDPKVIVAKLFQLVEWTHSLIVSTRLASAPSLDDAKQTHFKFLHWYRNFFSVLNAEGSRTPFILFAHVCYHFNLVCAFRPFVDVAFSDPDFSASDICSDAAQSILALAQSYDDMFTLQRASGMMPYFVLTAGLFGLAVEDSGSNLEPAYVLLRDQIPAMTQAKQGGQEFVPNLQGSPASISYVKVSMVDHARFLLHKISSTQVVAKLAISKLKYG